MSNKTTYDIRTTINKPNINIIQLNSQYFNNRQNTGLFVNTVYKNFFDLAKDDKLKHNFEEINRLIMSPLFAGYFVKYGTKIIGYLLGEILLLNDGRKVFYINYLYVSHYFRKSGIASKLLDSAIMYAKNLNLDAVMLTCDTENYYVHNFYLKRGFMLDMVLRKYEKHDVFSLPIKFF